MRQINWIQNWRDGRLKSLGGLCQDLDGYIRDSFQDSFFLNPKAIMIKKCLFFSKNMVDT